MPQTFDREFAASSQEMANKSDFANMLRIFWRGKWLIFLFAVLFMLLGGYYAFYFAEPRFVATARLALDLRQTNVLDLESVISGVSTETASLNTALEFIRSPDLIEMVVDELDLVEDPEFNIFLREKPKYSISMLKNYVRELIVGAPASVESPTSDAIRMTTANSLASIVSVTSQRNTYIFNIRATTSSGAKSASIVNTLAQVYLTDQVHKKLTAINSAVDFLAQRVNDLDLEIKTKSAELQDIRNNSNMISAETLSALSVRAKDLRERLIGSKSAYESVLKRQQELERVIATQDSMSSIAEQLEDATLSTIAAQPEGIDQLSLFDARLDRLQQGLSDEVARARAQFDALDAAFNDIQTEIDEQNLDLVTISDLTREISAIQVLYETFLTRLKETSAQIGLQRADAEILFLAQRGIQIAPRRSRIIAMSMVLGGMLGAGIVFLISLRVRGIRNSADLEKMTGLRVFGQIAIAPIRHRRDLLSYLRDNNASAFSEAIRNLRTSLLMSNIDRPPRVVLVTSSTPGEGKTTVSIALAQNLAGLEKRVLLIEGDIRRRTFTHYFKKTKAGGLFSVIQGENSIEDSAFHDEVLGADVIMGDKTSVNAADVFASERFKLVLETVREKYDFIIIDSPPVLAVPDSRIIGPLCDAVLYVVKWDSTSTEVVGEGIRQISSGGLSPTGLVLTQIDSRKMRTYGYDGHYGAYASDYYKE